MTFRSAANIDPNQHKGLILSNSITNLPLVATGLSLTNSQPLHVAITDSTGSQVDLSSLSGSSTATVSSVSASASNVTALSALSTRRVATFYNDADKACYLKFGTTASTSSFTIKIFPNGFFSMPLPAYRGQIDVIWDSSPTGSLRVTEY